MPRSDHSLERVLGKIRKYYQKKLPKLYKICYDPVGSHNKTRRVIGFFFGALLGFFIYDFVIVNLQLNKYVNWSCGTILVLLMSIGCASSMHFRCVCLLMIPGFFGRAGRTALKALVLGYIIAGPILNLTYNCKEVMRSFACTGQLTYNLTKTKFDLMFKPFKQTMMNMKEASRDMKETISSVKELIEPIKNEIEGEPNENRTVRDTKPNDYEEMYSKKIEARCEEQLARGSENCKKIFSDAYDKCFDTVTWLIGWLLCWPMKLTFVCNFLQALGFGQICNPKGKVDMAGFGQGYATLKESQEKLGKSLNEATIQFSLEEKQIIIGMQDTARMAKGVMRDFETRKTIVNNVMGFIKRCTSLLLLKIIFEAWKYHRKYLHDIEYDNVYITRYFRKIDARRKIRGSATILPLKKAERRKFVDCYSIRQTKLERRNIIGQSVKLLLEVMTASIFVILDRLLFELLDIVKRHAHLEITQTGHHELAIEIRGTGLIASLVRKLVRGLNTKRRLKNLVSNAICLPRATRVSASGLFLIYGTYFAIWILILAQAYSHRLRSTFAGWFYRKRRKRRVLHLYNETLRRRAGFLRYARAALAQVVRAKHLEDSWFTDWITSRSRMIRWLIPRTCLLCEESEPRGKDSYHRCSTPECLGIYCIECWSDLNEICPICTDTRSLPVTNEMD